MAPLDKPRQVVFNLLKQTWGIEHQDTLALLATDFIAAQYNNERKPARSREIVNIEPEKYYSGMFKPFEQTSATLVSSMHSAKRGPTTNGAIIDYFANDARITLANALERNGFDGTLFSNSTIDIVRDPKLNEADKAHLLVLLFCAAGCTGDVRNAVDETLRANRSMGARFLTTQQSDELSSSSAEEKRDYALLRIDAGGHGGRHVLSVEPEGTVLGRQAIGPNSITDVGMSVSKQHARVWRDITGTWWVQGLGSTNGTTLIDSATRETIEVEPPKDQQAGESDPVQLHLGDILTLAETTQFWVQAL